MKTKKLSRFLALALALCLLVALFAGCAGKTDEPQDPAESSSTPSEGVEARPSADASTSGETVKIGVLLPLSGATAYYGGVQLDGIKFCADYVNRNGGIASLGGAQIELVVQDSASSPETGISAFETLVESGVSAIVGPYNSTVAAATAPLAIQHEVPYVVINATAENFMGSANKYVYRTNTGSGDGDMIYSLAMEYLNEVRPDNPTDKVAIIYDSGDWGTAASATWSASAEDMGYTVVLNEAVSESTTDLSTVVSKIKSEDVDAVILATFSASTNLLVKQMYEYECSAKIVSLGGGTGDIAFIENCGDAAEGVMMLSSWLPKYGGVSDEAKPLTEEFADTYGYEMTMEPCWGWLGLASVVNALENAGSSDRDALADALYDLDVGADDWSCWFVDFEGVKFCTEGEESDKFATGVRYNNNIKTGERDGVVLVQVQGGQWTIVYPESGATINY